MFIYYIFYACMYICYIYYISCYIYYVFIKSKSYKNIAFYKSAFLSFNPYIYLLKNLVLSLN